MAQILPVIGVVAAVLAAGAAFYGSHQMQKLESLRATVGTGSAAVDTFAVTLRGQEAGVEARMQALRAIAATPEMPVSGAQLQAQIDRLVTLREQSLAMAAEDPATPALALSAGMLAEAAATRDALRAGGTALPDAGRAVLGLIESLGTTVDTAADPAALQAALEGLAAAPAR